MTKKFLKSLKTVKKIYFYEEGIRSGGVGEKFAALLAQKGIKASFKHFAIDDEFVKQADAESQLRHYHLDKNSIIDEVCNAKNE